MKWTRWRIPILFLLLLYLIMSAALAWLPMPADHDLAPLVVSPHTPTAQFTAAPRLEAWIVLPTNTPLTSASVVPAEPQPTTAAEATPASPVVPVKATPLPNLPVATTVVVALQSPATQTPAASAISQVTPTSESPVVTHIVKAGETLSGVAKEYGVTVQALVEANDLPNPDYLSIGQALTIPTVAPAGSTPTPAP